MDELNEYQPVPVNTTPPPPKKRVNPYVVIGLAIVIVVLAIVILVFLYNKSQDEKRALQAQLTETEKQLEVISDAFAAIEAKQNGSGEQDSIIADLQKQIEDLLKVEEPDPIITIVQIDEQLSSIKELVTKEYIYTNAARREGESKKMLWGVDVPFSDTSLLVKYDGTIKAGINLNKVKPSINEEQRTITILLPKAEILSNELPQETIEVLEVKNNLFSEITFDNYNEFIAEGKETMKQKAIERGILTDAYNEAKAIITNSLKLLPGMDSYTLIVK